MKKFFFAGLILLVLFFVACFTIFFKPYLQFAEKEQQLKAQIENENKIADDIEREKAYQGTDAFVEKKAREELGYVRPDEIVFYNRAAAN
ncbi:MAG: septum formation initiator family protein [Clostridiales bacterium]|jgi:cell division protein FtsB|nr:septum formation initiator family protein [Clostridiales bacterium]